MSSLWSSNFSHLKIIKITPREKALFCKQLLKASIRLNRTNSGKKMLTLDSSCLVESLGNLSNDSIHIPPCEIRRIGFVTLDVKNGFCNL